MITIGDKNRDRQRKDGGIGMLKKLKSLLVALVLTAGIASPAVSDDWSGFFIQGGLGYGDGTVELGIEDVASTTLATDGLLVEARFGYRWRLWQSRLYLGPVIGAEYGDVSGDQVYRFDPAYSELSYSSKLRATVGVQAGLQSRDENWLFTAEGGVAGLDGELCGEVGVYSLSRSECLDGYAMGYYVALGAHRTITDHLAGYLRLSHTWYELEDSFSSSGQSATALADVNTTRLMLGLELRF